jgi:uncharacterized protein (TIGR02594 family)
MTAEAPNWLLAMRAMSADGIKETPGSGDNPKILAMRDTIAATYPDMASYCALYQHDATPWCGLAVAYAMTMGGVRPVFGKTDTDRFLWAQAWDDDEWGYELSVPRPGCVVVMQREGGGHVTLYERTEGSSYVCRGGNQSDAVNQASYPISKVVALMWPKAEGPPPPAPRRELAKGASGPDVEFLQAALGIPPDGEFGAVTDAGVKGFQCACGLVVDGEVGPATWSKIDALVLRMETGSDGISEELKRSIIELALTHPIQHYVWEDRGRSPSGYIAGMGQCFALALQWLAADDLAAIEMAQAETGESEEDALAWYAAEFAKLGMSNAIPGVDTLRGLFTLMIGLGMRESSGKYYEGRDISATNTTSDTCEAGLFQMSWNMKTASPSMGKLLEGFFADPNGFLSIFSEGLTPTTSGLMNFGSGQGALFQFMAKYSPAFAVMTAAVGLRTRRTHWGPINRREVELVAEAADYLARVEELMAEGLTPEPEPEPTPEPEEPGAEVASVHIVTAGPVTVTVNGVAIGSNG